MATLHPSIDGTEMVSPLPAPLRERIVAAWRDAGAAADGAEDLRPLARGQLLRELIEALAEEAERDAVVPQERATLDQLADVVVEHVGLLAATRSAELHVP